MKTTLDHVDDTTFSLMTLDELEIYKRGNQKYCKALATGATIRIK